MHGVSVTGLQCWFAGAMMAEILVRLIDRSPGEDDAKRGDVVSVMPDGNPWSEAELTNPDWIILKVVSILATDRDVMLAARESFPRGRFRRREWSLDLDGAPLPARFTYPRKQASVTITRLGLAAMLKAKPALV